MPYAFHKFVGLTSSNASLDQAFSYTVHRSSYPTRGVWRYLTSEVQRVLSRGVNIV